MNIAHHSSYYIYSIQYILYPQLIIYTVQTFLFKVRKVWTIQPPSWLFQNLNTHNTFFNIQIWFSKLIYWFVVIKTKNNAQLMLAGSLLPKGAMVDEFPPTVCNPWDSCLLFVSYSCLCFAGTRDPPRLPWIGTITSYAVSYKYISRWRL